MHSSITIVTPQEQLPYSGEGVLCFYDGPLLLWLPHASLKLLAVALPEEAGTWPFLVAELSGEQAEMLLVSQLTLQGAVLAAERCYFLENYGAMSLQLAPILVVPDSWLPGDVYLSMERSTPS